jgi:hypothetical protein
MSQLRLREARRMAALVKTIFNILAILASIASLALTVIQGKADTAVHGSAGLNIVIHLALLTVIGYGILWSLAERIFHWNFGSGGGDSLPTGWSAVVLSLSVTLPLALVPVIYQWIRGIRFVSPFHWQASLLMVCLGVVSHLVMYGTNANGIRQRYARTGEYANLNVAVLLEFIYSVVYFFLIVLPYRIVAQPGEHASTLIVARTILPAFAYFFCMMAFEIIKYPGSLRDRTWIQVRGFYAGIIIMFCFCAGMFL